MIAITPEEQAALKVLRDRADHIETGLMSADVRADNPFSTLVALFDRLIAMTDQHTDKERGDLLICYTSGQIPEPAWQEHLRADPKLRELAEPPEYQVRTELGSSNKLPTALPASGEIDLAAQALWQKHRDKINPMAPIWDELPDSIKDQVRDDAKAVIAALRSHPKAPASGEGLIEKWKVLAILNTIPTETRNVTSAPRTAIDALLEATSRIEALFPSQPASGEVIAWHYEYNDIHNYWRPAVMLATISPGEPKNPPTAHHGKPVRNVLPLYGAQPASGKP